MATKTVVLEGRTWTVEYCGPTKYGRRAKLKCDGEERWVNASVVEGGGTRPARKAGGATCCECGRGGKLVQDLEDGAMKHYGCCDIPPGGG